jgi:hypothetical protein
MKLLLMVMFAWIMLGLLAPKFERRERLAVVGLAVAVALVYYRFGERFM